jgi:phosphatidate cytidylyltransferase
VTEQNRNLAIRLASAFVALPVVLYLVYLGSWPLACLLGLAAAVCALEYYEITMGKRRSPAAWIGIALTGALPFTPLVTNGGAAAFWIVAGYGIFCWTYHLLRGPLKEAPLLIAHLVNGMVYSAAGLTSMQALRQGPLGGHWVMSAVVVTFANDTFAYFTGRAIGKRKLYPEVSPNKTWEGFFGGMVGSVSMLFVYRAILFHQLTVVDVVVLGIAGALMGPVGDLAESMLKRSYGVKDSGKIMPGHGGILDRIDALVFNGPLTYVWVHFVRDLILPPLQ